MPKSLREYAEEYRDDEQPRRRKPFACSDGMCGLLDCAKCNGPFEEQEDEE